MEPKDFAGEIERARTMLQANYRSVTVSASMTAGMPSRSVFISVKTPYWTHEMERREECATDMPLSEWIYREVRFSHAPDIAKAAHSGEGGVMSKKNKIWYAVLDARYNYDEDGAVCLTTNDTLEGAIEDAKEHGEGNVVVTLEKRPDGFSHPIASQAVYTHKEE